MAWSDGKKWVMGILSALVVAILIGIGHHFLDSSRSESSTDIAPPGQSTPQGGGTSVPERPVSSPEKPEPAQVPSPVKQSAGGFDFTLEGCRPDGDDLRCRVQVTTRPETKRLMVSNHSRLKVDKKSIEPYKLIKDTGKDYSTAIHFDVPAGEEVEFSVVFRGMRTVREAELLEVKCAGFSVKWDRPAIG